MHSLLGGLGRQVQPNRLSRKSGWWLGPVSNLGEIEHAAGELRAEERDLTAGEHRTVERDLTAGEHREAEVGSVVEDDASEVQVKSVPGGGDVWAEVGGDEADDGRAELAHGQPG